MVVMVSDNPSEYIEENVRYVKCNAKRIEAKMIGTNLAKYDSILFLDSDQIAAPDLIDKIFEFDSDMGIIPERSCNRHLMAKLMDAKRKVTESRMRSAIDISLPVVPRLFKRELLLKVFASLDDKIIKNVTETEDSIIFYEALKYSRDVGWINSYIYNMDPSLREFVRKSFNYGKNNERGILNCYLSEEYIKLIRKIQIETMLNNRSYSPAMFLVNLLRGVPYTFGMIYSRLKIGDKG